MGAIGLLDIPPEMQLQIAEFVETPQTLKALSVISRSLRSIAQSILFKKLRIGLGKELKGSVGDLLANPRICAAIRFLSLHTVYGSDAPRKVEEQLSLIQKLLPEMVGLRMVSIYYVNLSKTFLDAFLGIAAITPLQILLGWNIYPYSVFPTPHTPLQISHLHCSDNQIPLEFYRSMFHASATALTRLNIQPDGDGLMELADINLPSLHDLTLSITKGDGVSRLLNGYDVSVQPQNRPSSSLRPAPLQPHLCPATLLVCGLHAQATRPQSLCHYFPIGFVLLFIRLLW